jgi:hypothetical protein
MLRLMSRGRSSHRPVSWTAAARAACVALLLVGAIGVPPALAAQPPAPQDEFKPVGNNPAPEQIPAAPLLIGAYIVVLSGLFFYVVSLSRRLGAVRQDVERLEGELKRRGRS